MGENLRQQNYVMNNASSDFKLYLIKTSFHIHVLFSSANQTSEEWGVINEE